MGNQFLLGEQVKFFCLINNIWQGLALIMSYILCFKHDRMKHKHQRIQIMSMFNLVFALSKFQIHRTKIYVYLIKLTQDCLLKLKFIYIRKLSQQNCMFVFNGLQFDVSDFIKWINANFRRCRLNIIYFAWVQSHAKSKKCHIIHPLTLYY